MTIRRRTLARRLAVQALCAFEGVGDAFADQLHGFLTDAHTLDDLGIDHTPDEETVAYARSLALETWRRRAALDERLGRASERWRVERMPPVDRNVLRLGLHELTSGGDVPARVVISEAIELAKLFGGEESGRFVNGLLDALAPEHGPAPPGGAPTSE